MNFDDREQVEAAAAVARERLGGGAALAVILGSGFQALSGLLEGPVRVPYRDLPGFGSCSAPGHAGELLAGTIGGGKRCALFSGRFHLYEGLRAEEAVAPVALARALGADRILLTSAAGATSDRFAPGDLVLVEDHINLTGENPIRPRAGAERRPAFLAMGSAYDRDALALAEKTAARGGRAARRAALAAVTGPSFETPAEYRALARLGADVVTMSGALETIAARAIGLRVLALTIVANTPARLGEHGAAGDEVLSVVENSVRMRLGFFKALIEAFAAL